MEDLGGSHLSKQESRLHRGDYTNRARSLLHQARRVCADISMFLISKKSGAFYWTDERTNGSLP